MGCHKLHIKQNKVLVKGALGLYVGFKKGCAGAYRYGFNGQEKDNEIKGTGNSINYKARIQDTRLGRFLSIDPLTANYPMLTSYQFASNSPIWGVDQDGKELRIYTEAYPILESHTFISLMKDNDIVVYEFGTYNGGNFVNGCQMVMLRYSGDDAKCRIKEAVNDEDARCYNVNGIEGTTAEKNMVKVLDNIFYSSNLMPDDPNMEDVFGHFNDPNARIVNGEYKILSNNCTTMSINILGLLNNNAFQEVSKYDQQRSNVYSNMILHNSSGIIVSPQALETALDGCIKEGSKQINECTEEVKKEVSTHECEDYEK